MSRISLDAAPVLVVDPDLELGCPLGCSSSVTIGTLAAHIDDEHVLPIEPPRPLLDVLAEHVERVRADRGDG